MTVKADILVTGAGATGLSAALALAESGFDVILAGRPDTASRSRTVALLEGSLRFFRALGAWDGLAADAAPMVAIRIVDDTGSLFRLPPVTFEASEIGLEAFGANIEAVRLVAHLAALLPDRSKVRWIDDTAESFVFREDEVEARFANGESAQVKLVVAADGARSLVRQAAGIGVATWAYPQTALTAILAHGRAHHAASTEFHTRGGPFTLVPLSPSGTDEHRSSLVWLMRPDEARRRENLEASAFALEAEHQAHSILGAFKLEQKVSTFPMHGLRSRGLVGRRVALVGEAAHVLPPIGAQGLNLGLRDIAHLADCLRHQRADAGNEAALRAYESRRRGDIGSRSRGVDTLNRSLLVDWLPADFLRGLGLAGLSALPPLRRAIMRQGIMPTANLPSLMRPSAGPGRP